MKQKYELARGFPFSGYGLQECVIGRESETDTVNLSYPT
jgi:hypothetical protein